MTARTDSRLPGMAAAARQAGVDFYFNSWRLAPANLVWTASLVASVVAAGIWLPFVVLVGLVAVPVAGLHRMAALIVRGESVALSDFFDGMRRLLGPAAVTGVTSILLATMFTSNVLTGLDTGGVVGWTLGAFALYGDIGLAVVLVAWWPILADPRREDVPLRRRLSLAGLVILARPGRFLVLTALIVGVLIVSVLLFAAIAIFAVAYSSLLAARYVLPLADVVEERMAARRTA